MAAGDILKRVSHYRHRTAVESLFLYSQRLAFFPTLAGVEQLPLTDNVSPTAH